jgi:hypothetical protein
MVAIPCDLRGHTLGTSRRASKPPWIVVQGPDTAVQHFRKTGVVRQSPASRRPIVWRCHQRTAVDAQRVQGLGKFKDATGNGDQGVPRSLLRFRNQRSDRLRQ